MKIWFCLDQLEYAAVVQKVEPLQKARKEKDPKEKEETRFPQEPFSFAREDRLLNKLCRSSSVFRADSWDNPGRRTRC